MPWKNLHVEGGKPKQKSLLPWPRFWWLSCLPGEFCRGNCPFRIVSFSLALSSFPFPPLPPLRDTKELQGHCETVEVGDWPYMLFCNSLARLCIIQSEVTFFELDESREALQPFCRGPRLASAPGSRLHFRWTPSLAPSPLTGFSFQLSGARVPRHFLAAEFRDLFFFLFLLKCYFIALSKSSSLFTVGKSISADIIKINHSSE